MLHLRIPSLNYRHAIALGCVLLSTHAQAQTIPGSARLERVEKEFEKPIVPELAEVAPEGEPPGFHSAVPKGAEKLRFVLKELRLEGNTVYPTEQLAGFYKDSLGKEITVADVYAIGDAITRHYRDNGYVLARAGIPAQALDGGVARIHVVEGYVAKVRFKEAKWQRGVLKELATRVEAMRPLHMPTLQHMLLAQNADSSLAVTTVIEPLQGKEATDGAVGMLIEVERKRISTALRLDNEGSRFIGPWQQTIEATLRDTAFSYDTLRVRELTSLPHNELHYGSFSYSLPLDAFGTALGIDASLSHSRPGYNLRSFDIHSDSNRFSVSLERPWLWARDKRLSTNLALERKDLQTDVLGTELYHDIITAARAGVSGQYADGLNGVTLGSVTLSQGLNALGARESRSSNLSRANGKSDFTKLEATVSRLQPLGSGFSATASATGQYAFSQLLSSEQCGYGGMSFGRAFDASEITGDSCIAASLEVSHAGWDVPSTPLHVAPFAFYDIGKTWTATARESGASAGPGLRMNWERAVEAQLTAAFPLTREIANPLDGNEDGPRYGLRLVGKY